MKIEYELVPEDWGEFAVHVASQSRSLHRSRLTIQLVGSASVLLLAVAEARLHGPMWAVLGLLFAVAWWMTVPHMMDWSLRRHAKSRVRPCLRGRHTLEIVQEGIQATCDVSTSLHKWPGIRAVDGTPTHVFVLIGDALGYAVPRHRIVSGDIDAFVRAARAQCSR